MKGIKNQRCFKTHFQVLAAEFCRNMSKLCARRKGRGTSGSPVSWLVWMRIFPSRMSLHTAISACSMVSPALRMDTPVICRDQRRKSRPLLVSVRTFRGFSLWTPHTLGKFLAWPAEGDRGEGKRGNSPSYRRASCRCRRPPAASPRTPAAHVTET